MIFAIFALWLSFLPLIKWQTGFEGPKIVYFLLGALALLIFWIVRLVKNLKNINFSRSDYFFLAWLLILSVASIFGIHPLESFLGGSYRHQGVIFFLGLWLLGKTIQLLNKERRILLVRQLGVVILVESVIVALQFVGENLYFGRPLGTIGETNAVAGFLVIGSYFVFETSPKISLVIPFVAIVLTMSRSGILSAFAPSLIYVNRLSKKVRNILPLVIIGVLIFLVFLSGSKGNSFFENRSTIWSLGIHSILEKPVLGFGAESGEAVYDLAFYKSGFPLSGLIVDRSHNLFLDVLMWSGAVGLVAFIGWLYSVFNGLEITKKFTFLSFLLYSMFQPLSVVHWILLIIVVNI